MISRRKFCLGLSAAALVGRHSILALGNEVFAAEMYRIERDQAMPYRLFASSPYENRVQYPLVLWLCGAAGRGTNNLNQISFGNVIGSHIWTKAENQAKHPCFVVAPQCPDNKAWTEGQDPATQIPLGAKPAETLLLALEICGKSFESMIAGFM